MTAFWIIIIVAFFCLLQIAYYHRRGLRRVSYTRSFSRGRVFEGEEAELVEVLVNDKLIPVPWVRVESRISANLRFAAQENLNVEMDQFHKSVFFLGSYSRITRTHKIECRKRGYYDCGSVHMVAGDLLGISSCRRDVRCDAALYVYPRVLKPEELPENALKWQGDIAVRRWIAPDPILVNGIREYRTGDNMRDIHWGATARTGQMQVKTRDYTVSPRVMLIFNSQISDNLFGGMAPEDADFLERGISTCAALAAWCVDAGIDVGFTTNGENRLNESGDVFIEPRTGESQLEAILEMLALLKIKMRVGIQRVLDTCLASGMTGMDVLLVSAYWSDTLGKRAEQLRAAGNSVTYIPIKGGSRV